MNGILAHFPLILCFIFGIVFLVLEAIIPGIGAAGVVGLGFSVAAIVLTAQSFGPMAAFGISVVIFVVSAIAFSITLRSLRVGKLSKSYVLQDEEKAVANPQESKLIGFEGHTTSELRPVGIAEIAGNRLEVVSRGGFLKAGVKVKVVAVEDLKIIVEESERSEA